MCVCLSMHVCVSWVMYVRVKRWVQLHVDAGCCVYSMFAVCVDGFCGILRQQMYFSLWWYKMNKKYLNSLSSHAQTGSIHAHKTVRVEHIYCILTDCPWGFHSFCRKTFIDIYPDKIRDEWRMAKIWTAHPCTERNTDVCIDRKEMSSSWHNCR